MANHSQGAAEEGACEEVDVRGREEERRVLAPELDAGWNHDVRRRRSDLIAGEISFTLLRFKNLSPHLPPDRLAPDDYRVSSSRRRLFQGTLRR